MIKILFIVCLSLCLVSCNISGKSISNNEKVLKKYELYKGYPYTRYYVITDKGTYQVNKTVFNNIK